MQPKGSIRLIHVSRWRSATRIDDLSQKQVVQPKGSIRLIQVSRWRSATRTDNLSQKQVMQPGNQCNSYKSADGDQQLALTTSAKSRSCSLGISSTQASQRWRSITHIDDLSQNQVVQPKGSIRLIQVSRWRSATRTDNLSQNQVTQPKESIQLIQKQVIGKPCQKQVMQFWNWPGSNKLVHEASATQFDDLNFPIQTLNSGHTVHEEKRKYSIKNANLKEKRKKMNIY